MDSFNRLPRVVGWALAPQNYNGAQTPLKKGPFLYYFAYYKVKMLLMFGIIMGFSINLFLIVPYQNNLETGIGFPLTLSLLKNIFRFS